MEAKSISTYSSHAGYHNWGVEYMDGRSGSLDIWGRYLICCLMSSWILDEKEHTAT